MMTVSNSADIAVVGGGLAGLAAATLLAREGRRVVLFEKGAHVGGRARSELRDGFTLNLGAHALYRGGEAELLLRKLGLSWNGGDPARVKIHVDSPKGVVSLGSSLFSLLGSSLLSSAEKWELLRVFTFIRTQTFERWDGVPFSEWLRASIRHPRTRAVVEMLARVATYTNAPQHASAGAFLRQVQCALRGVRYLDGGWQTLVEGVLFRAREAGVEVRTHAKVEAIEHEGKVKAVRLAGGEKLFVSGALICASPVDAARLCDVPQLRAFAAKAQPVQAACMDLGLRLLPNPRVPVCLSESAPLYLSAHSEVAKLAPDGTAALVHLIKYGAANAASDEHELEAFADKIQPGWREHVVFRRYLPSLTVSHASVLAADGGEKGRPKAKVADVQGLAIAGDWVGDRGMLLDAALASAQEAVRVLLTEVPLSTEQARGIRQVAG